MRTPSLSLSVVSALLALATGAHAADEPFIDLGIPSALARAEKAEQIVLLFFHEEVNPSSRRMREQTFADEGVRTWLAKHAVCVQIPMTDLKATSRFSVESTPYMVVLRSDARVVHRMDGFKDPTDFLVDVQIALIGLGEVKRPEGDDAGNPVAWLAWANWLFANETQKADDCATAYFWCMDHGEEAMPGFRARHLEFLLERLSYLKSRSSVAIDGLVSRRQDLLSHVSAGIATPLQSQEYCRYNYWLRDTDQTVEVFAKLGEYDTEVAEASRWVLFEHELKRIVDHRHYDAVLGLVPDPLAQIDRRLRAYDKQVAGGAQNPPERAKIIADAVCYYECLLHAGLGADAMELFERVTSKVPTGRSYFAFLERAQRLELYDLARKIADIGLEKVASEKGKKMLEKAKIRIPATSELGKGTTPIPAKGDRGDGDR